MRASGWRPSAFALLADIISTRGSAVVDPRGVAGRHRPCLFERGLEAGERFGRRAVLDEFVGVEHHPALAADDLHRDDLVLEAAGLLRGLGLLLMAAKASCSSREMPYFLATFSGSGAHVVVVVGIPQAVVDHRVDHLPVAHALAIARAHHHMRRSAHVLLAAGDDDVRIAATDGLRGQMGGLEARAADLAATQRKPARRSAGRT